MEVIQNHLRLILKDVAESKNQKHMIVLLFRQVIWELRRMDWSGTGDRDQVKMTRQ
jgi:hypothetical protein